MRIWKFVAPTLVALVSVVALAVPTPDTKAVDEPGTRSFVDVGSGAITDGTYIVWEQEAFDNGRDGSHLFVEVISTGERTKILDSHPGVGNIDVDEGIVVWTTAQDDNGAGPYRVYGYDVDEERTFGISDTGNLGGSTISADTVIWRQTHWHGGDEFSYAIMGRNIRTMDDPFTIHEGNFIGSIKLDGDRVLWQEQDARYHWRLMTKRIGSDTPQFVAEGINISPAGSFGYDIAGTLIVYVNGPNNIFAIDLNSDRQTAIPIEPYDQRPVTDGRFVFWSGNDSDESTRDVLSGFDLETGSRFTVHGTASSTSPSPSIGGDFVTWRTGTGDNLVNEIYLAPIPSLLPFAPRPEPADDNPNRLWFPETGHSIVFGFKNFWEESGGLPVFGFPLSHEFDEWNQDTDEFHTVQYFERQRYEYHPELAGTPYAVQLGRLGYEDALTRGLLDDDAFQPINGNPGDEEQCHYFEETGFAACSEFLDYWQSHGLDFGDDGVSFRESFALFGYPISQVYFTPPGSGADPVTIQYFERARFEFHPGNSEEHRVLLGRLGADLIEQRDW